MRAATPSQMAEREHAASAGYIAVVRRVGFLHWMFPFENGPNLGWELVEDGGCSLVWGDVCT